VHRCRSSSTRRRDGRGQIQIDINEAKPGIKATESNCNRNLKPFDQLAQLLSRPNVSILSYSQIVLESWQHCEPSGITGYRPSPTLQSEVDVTDTCRALAVSPAISSGFDCRRTLRNNEQYKKNPQGRGSGSSHQVIDDSKPYEYYFSQDTVTVKRPAVETRNPSLNVEVSVSRRHNSFGSLCQLVEADTFPGQDIVAIVQPLSTSRLLSPLINMPSLGTLPAEIIHEIVRHLDEPPFGLQKRERKFHRRKDSLSLASATKRMRDIIFVRNFVHERVMEFSYANLIRSAQKGGLSVRSQVQ
jgi:hypothetical protein